MSSSIPTSPKTVRVSAISPNQVLGVPPSAFLTPDIKGTTYSDTPCLCFLIEHTDARGQVSRVLFDLGIRKDWENSPPTVVDAVKSMDIQINTGKDVPDILVSNGIELKTIDHIILSHWHFDHIGDPTRFPLTTGLVVGPGFKDLCLPGFPTNPESMLTDEAFIGREVKEVNFNKDLCIADLEAIDWYGDGSLYLLNTPGHAVGHISALARTSGTDEEEDSTFIMLSGDVCHHAGELRPTEQQPVPTEIPADVRHTYKSRSQYCGIHPSSCLSQPFYCPSAGGFNLDATIMKHTVNKVAKLDADPNVFVVLAHDHWLLDIIELFPQNINDWRARGWKEQCKWRFLLDFDD